MKNVKSFIKNKVGTFFFFFNLLLSLIGIITAGFSLKMDRFDNFLLIFLPVSSVLWILFCIFARIPQENIESEKEIEPSSFPPRKEISPLFEKIIKISTKILILICILIVLTCFFMTILLAGKIDISRGISLHPLTDIK